MIEKDCQTTTNKIYPELEVTVAAFSGGPIGPGDQYNTFNMTLTWHIAYNACGYFTCLYVSRAHKHTLYT